MQLFENWGFLARILTVASENQSGTENIESFFPCMKTPILLEALMT
jgi:hypothetical protein